MPELDVRARLEAALPPDVSFDEQALALLQVAQEMADDIAALKRLLAEQGSTVKGSMGQAKLNPVYTELRLSRSALARVIAAIRIPDDSGRPKSARHKAAAEYRWRRARRGAV